MAIANPSDARRRPLAWYHAHLLLICTLPRGLRNVCSMGATPCCVIWMSRIGRGHDTHLVVIMHDSRSTRRSAGVPLAFPCLVCSRGSATAAGCHCFCCCCCGGDDDDEDDRQRSRCRRTAPLRTRTHASLDPRQSDEVTPQHCPISPHSSTGARGRWLATRLDHECYGGFKSCCPIGERTK